MLSPNLGGNLMCLNTTFSSCIRQGNEDSEFSFENRTQGDRLDSIPASVASISFTLCTFNEMTVDADPFEGGAAILLSDTSSSVTVRTNFFHKCTSTGEYNFGGAICFIGASGRYPTLSISHSSFTECSTQFGWDVFSFGGGSIHVSAASTTIMTTCFFDQSTADSDGALFLATNFAEIANTVFADCSATNRGGAMSLERVNILNLSYLHFRGCSSVRDSRAKDINILGRSRLRSGKV
ncbi:hypothetical protein BLNAU_18579 [Blattamonas nauphoetae]|uniref:Right handed beta helix domain-containing protein n=1 Tax=Blattamonas nauphoetae TaxID=2049346 RepID=A0ABQ9X3Y4_9EUKA|nr:hypothetical protein BLNAU_18579 [Blattamonas nauphoetae]